MRDGRRHQNLLGFLPREAALSSAETGITFQETVLRVSSSGTLRLSSAPCIIYLVPVGECKIG